MQLHRIKRITGRVWVLAICIVAFAVQVSGATAIAAVAMALVPPLTLLLSNHPAQTTSESIGQAR